MQPPSPAQNPTATAPAPLRGPVLLEIRAALQAAAETAANRLEFLQTGADLLSSTAQFQGQFLVSLTLGKPPQLIQLGQAGGPLPDEIRKTMIYACERNAGKPHTVCLPLPSRAKEALILVPLSSGKSHEFLAAWQPLTQSPLLLELLVSQLEAWELRQQQRTGQQLLESMAALTELIAKLEQSSGLTAAGQSLVEELERHLKCDVLVGVVRPGKTELRLLAWSGMQTAELSQDQRALREAALEEILIRDRFSIWPVEETGNRHAMLTLRELADKSGSLQLIGIPLKDAREHPLGACLLLSRSSEPFPREAAGFLQAAAQPLGSTLSLLMRAEQGTVPAWLRRTKERFRSRVGTITMGLLTLCGLAMFLPWPHQIACECRLEPVEKRFVTAPFEATLEESSVQPGMVVQAGESLGRFDGREIRWELAGLAAQASQAQRKLDAALVEQDFSTAQLEQLELTRLELEKSVQEYRERNLELRSPIDGMIVSGDPRDLLGARFQVGQTLFEIAPLARMVVEVEIPEEEIAFVQPGQSLEIVLEAFPDQTWEGIVERVHPRSEIREEQNVFIAETILDNPQHQLKPGMRGYVRISGGSRALGWVLFHKPLDQLRLRWGW